MEVKHWKPGDPCPGCGGELHHAPQPTEAERRKAADRENPQPLPPHYDTAPADVVEERGELYSCAKCGPQVRYKAPEADRGDARERERDGELPRAPRPQR